MYEANAKLVWEEYEGKLSGCLSGLWCIFSDATPDSAAHHDAAFGSGSFGCAAPGGAVLGNAASRSTTISSTASGGAALDDAAPGGAIPPGGGTFNSITPRNAALGGRAHSCVPLSDAARSAIGKSAAALGYGEASCTFVAQTGSLSAHDIFSIAEGIDPLCVIAADETSAKALADAYGQAVPLDASCRLFGRDAVAFRSFEALLDSNDHKQKAWALLKQLPRI